MQTTLKIFGFVALGFTIVPPTMFIFGAIALPTVKVIMAIGCLLWFATAPFFMKGGAD